MHHCAKNSGYHNDKCCDSPTKTVCSSEIDNRMYNHSSWLSKYNVISYNVLSQGGQLPTQSCSDIKSAFAKRECCGFQSSPSYVKLTEDQLGKIPAFSTRDQNLTQTLKSLEEINQIEDSKKITISGNVTELSSLFDNYDYIIIPHNLKLTLNFKSDVTIPSDKALVNMGHVSVNSQLLVYGKFINRGTIIIREEENEIDADIQSLMTGIYKVIYEDIPKIRINTGGILANKGSVLNWNGIIHNSGAFIERESQQDSIKTCGSLSQLTIALKPMSECAVLPLYMDRGCGGGIFYQRWICRSGRVGFSR